MTDTQKQPAPEVFDIGSLDIVATANSGVDVDIFHPGTTRDLGMTITVLGKDSEEFIKMQRAQNRRRMAKIQKAGRFNASTISPEEIEEDALELLAACTKKWTQKGIKEGCIRYKGQDLPFTVANAELVYKDLPWLREQVDAAINDRSLFTKAS